MNNCAHHITDNSTTCFTLEAIKQMSHDYNNAIKKKLINGKHIKLEIIESNNKKKIFTELHNSMQKYCSNDHICFTKQTFMSNKDYLKSHFKPLGTKGQYDWVSTIEINELMNQVEYKYKYFMFGGAIPRDVLNINYPIMNREHYIKDLQLKHLLELKKPIISYIYNLDEHWQSGSHWVALYCNIPYKHIYFFDSYGLRPHKDIRKMVRIMANYIYQYHHTNCNYNCKEFTTSDSFMKHTGKNILEDKIGGKIEWNRNRHQYKSTECGVYSCHFIIKLLEGKTFNDLSNIKISDDDINKYRKVFWR